MEDHSVLIHDASRREWLLFGGPAEIVTTGEPSEVEACLRRIEAAAAGGKYAAGFVAYEAASGLDAAIRTKGPAGLPLVWFGIYDSYTTVTAPKAGGEGPTLAWEPSVTQEAYHAAIAKIKQYLWEGETYQVNYSFRLRAPLCFDPYAIFCELIAAQRADYGAYVTAGDFVLCCASPELFFERDGRRVRSRPMKGTLPRGLSSAEDLERALELHHSEKNRAENVMIVDMVRNDLHRVCEPGSVRVEGLFETERYPTVWQMTSTVSGETEAGLAELFKAMFPAASITGAPKVRTSELIVELEDSPRRIYTGSIGFVCPGPQRRAQFNVAIRTVLIDRKARTAEYGIGGGIVWDSAAQGEYRECFDKARVLTHRRPEFSLLETLLWTPGERYFLLDRHLRRLGESAEYFGYAVDMERVRRLLLERAEGFERTAQRVRLLVDETGECCIESRRFEGSGAPPRVCLAKTPVSSGDVFLYHKTTHREVYKEKLAQRSGYDDVLLWNERGEVTETCIANVVVERGGERLTPAAECGLLAGTYRERLLEENEIREAVIRVEDLRDCDAVYFINSVRGRFEADIEGIV